MNKLIPIALLILVAIGSAGYYFFVVQKPQVSDIPDTQTKEAMNDESVSLMSLKELIATGKPQKCSFSYSHPSSGERVSGTTYISGEKVRSDFDGVHPNQTAYSGGMILDGTEMYTWSSEREQGIKMAISGSTEEALNEASTNPSSEGQPYDPSMKTQYTCTTWDGDEDTFIPPSNVSFIDISDQMKMIEGFNGASEDDGIPNQ